MSKTLTFFIGSLLGIIVGGGLIFYFFVSVPRSVQMAGVPIQPPSADQPVPTTAQIVLKQEFFNDILKTIFRDTNPPTFPLGATENGEAPPQVEGQCVSSITILPNGSGINSSVSFANNRIVAPLAFRGSYSSMFGCFNFSGWTQANLEMRYDAEKQIVFGYLNIETVNLDGVNPLLSGIITPLVQSTLNQRFNPIQILEGSKLALDLPLKSSKAKLKANVKDVRSEIKDNALNLYVIYEFVGEAVN